MVNTGIVEINTRCSDIAFRSCSAELLFDGKFKGYTPIQFFSPAGKHEYKIVKPGYTCSPHSTSPMSGIIDVKAETKNTFDVEMVNTSEIGGISINSTPEGAKVFLDDNDQGTIAPIVVSTISPGEHRYRMTLPGYSDVEGKFTTILGEPIYIHDSLVQLKDFGTLYIHATPILYGIIVPYILEGAKIYIDNVYSGKNIPMPITGLTKGVHTYRVEKNGLEDREGMFIINGDDILIINIYPILKPKTGILIIHLSPFIGDIKVGKLYLNGEDTGGYTDLRHALPEGTYTYRIHIDGFIDPEGTFEIVANRITRITPHLCHLGTLRLGMLDIKSNPSGALVSVDGVNMGQYTPTSVKHIPEGDCTYKISKPGYLDAIGTVTIENSDIINLNPTLIQNDSILDISCNIIAAMVYIDNKTEELTTPTEIIGISPGIHTYRLVIPTTYGNGFDDATGTFIIEKGKTTKIDAVLTPRKDKILGSLTVNSIPTSARIFIDDVDTGLNTPHDIMELTSGVHKIKLTLPGYKDWIGTVNIIQGSIVSITEELIK